MSNYLPLDIKYHIDTQSRILSTIILICDKGVLSKKGGHLLKKCLSSRGGTVISSSGALRASLGTLANAAAFVLELLQFPKIL